MSEKFTITPETKINDILTRFPELEEKLVQLSPAFGRLKNPILRKTIGRIATVRQVAATGNIPLGEFIQRLREWTGSPIMASSVVEESTPSTERPNWFNPNRIKGELDARPILDRGKHPLQQVMKDLSALEPGDIYRLTTPFLPIPLLEQVKQKGYECYTEQEGEDIFQNYIYKPVQN